MFRKYAAVVLAVVAFLSLPVTSLAQSPNAEKNRLKLQSLSLNRDKKIEVRLRDKTKYRGHITAVDGDSFTLRDEKTSASLRIPYSELEEVKKVGGGISTKTWIIVGGVAAGTITTWLIVKPAFCDGGAVTRGIC